MGGVNIDKDDKLKYLQCEFCTHTINVFWNIINDNTHKVYDDDDGVTACHMVVCRFHLTAFDYFKLINNTITVVESLLSMVRRELLRFHIIQNRNKIPTSTILLHTPQTEPRRYQ